VYGETIDGQRRRTELKLEQDRVFLSRGVHSPLLVHNCKARARGLPGECRGADRKSQTDFLLQHERVPQRAPLLGLDSRGRRVR
jgi:hypothetical protein